MILKYSPSIKPLDNFRTVPHSQLPRLLYLLGVLITFFQLRHIVLLDSESMVLEEGLFVPCSVALSSHLLLVIRDC